MRWYKGTDLWVGRQRSGDHWSWTAKGKHVKRNLKHREKLRLLRALPVPRGTQTSVKRNISSLTRKPKRGTLWSSFTNTVPCLIMLQFKFLLLYQRTYTHPHSIWIVSFLSGVGGRNLLECSFRFFCLNCSQHFSRISFTIFMELPEITLTLSWEQEEAEK